MPPSERASLLIAGAVVGVLGVLLTLFALVSSVDAHYVTRKEYEATLLAIHSDLTEIRSDLRAHMSQSKATR